MLSIPHPPCLVESTPWAHHPQGRCHCSSPSETQQAFRNRAFTLLPNHGVLVVLLQTLSTPSSPFLCLHSPFLVSIPSMTAVPPTPGSLQSTLLLAGRTGSASLIFTHPQLPSSANLFEFLSAILTPGPLHMPFPLPGVLFPPFPPVHCEFSLRLQCWKAVLSSLIRWDAGPVWVPCRVSPGICCCDCQIHCSGSVSSHGPGMQ